MMKEPADSDGQIRVRPWRSLPVRLLGLTIVFVMLAEVLIFLPSAANFQREWMRQRVAAAKTAALAVEAAPDGMIDEALTRELLMYAEVEAIAMFMSEERMLVLTAPDSDPMNLKTVDLREMDAMNAISSVSSAFTAPAGQHLRLIDSAPERMGEGYIEVIVPQAPLKRDLIAYSTNIFWLSIIISLFTAMLIYFSLTLMLVRPVRRLARDMARFRDAPEDANSESPPRRQRGDEIGEAERAFTDMQAQVRHSLAQRARLAQLGEAVARISHDLRNILSSAEMVSARLASEEDPRVRAIGERLVRAVSRGVNLTEATLKYGKAEEKAPEPKTLALRPAVEDAAAEAGAFERELSWRNEVPGDAKIRFDAEHLHRILVNLIRNALQATETADAPALSVTAEERDGALTLRIADNGSGMPAVAQETLFRPFAHAGAHKGTGLGLSIARELARANHGDVTLAVTGEAGAAFEVRAPRL